MRHEALVLLRKMLEPPHSLLLLPRMDSRVGQGAEATALEFRGGSETSFSRQQRLSNPVPKRLP